MPAKDRYHDIVRTALEAESWQITHDPYKVMLGGKRGFIDLAAEKMLAAEKGNEKIAVEIKSFLGASGVDEFEDALGQFLIYQTALIDHEPNRTLYLAIPALFYNDFFDDLFFRRILERFKVPVLVYDEKQQTILQWIS